MKRTVKFDVSVEIKDTASLLKKGINTDELIKLTYQTLEDANHYDYYDEIRGKLGDVLTDDELNSNILNVFDATDMKELEQFMTVINGEAGYNSYETGKWFIGGVVYDVPVEFDVDMFVETVISNNTKKPEFHIVKSTVLSSEEFEKIIKDITDGDVVPTYDPEGLSWNYDENVIDSDDIDEYIRGELATYFNIPVSTIHISYSGEYGLSVWITFKDCVGYN